MGPLDDLYDHRRKQQTQRRTLSRGRVVGGRNTSRFWQPSDELVRQPFYGFPGGQSAWEAFRSSGVLPNGVELSPEARNFYYKAPATFDFGRQMPSQFSQPGVTQSGPMPTGLTISHPEVGGGPLNVLVAPTSIPGTTGSAVAYPETITTPPTGIRWR